MVRKGPDHFNERADGWKFGTTALMKGDTNPQVQRLGLCVQAQCRLCGGFVSFETKNIGRRLLLFPVQSDRGPKRDLFLEVHLSLTFPIRFRIGIESFCHMLGLGTGRWSPSCRERIERNSRRPVLEAADDTSRSASCFAGQTRAVSALFTA